jgi:cytochrome P450
LPPGPTSGVLTQTVALHRDPLGALRHWQTRFGDVFTIRLATARPLVIVAAPDAVAPIADADPASAHAGEGRRRILPMASPRGAFGADGAGHRAARGRIAGALSLDALEGHRASIERLAEKHVEHWPARRVFRLLPRVRSLVDDVFVRLVLGIHDEERAQAIAGSLRRLLWTPGNPPFMVPGEGDGLAGLVGQRVFARRRAPVATVLEAEIEARRRHGELGDDLIGAVLRDQPRVPARAIADELLVVLMAAQEPPAIALTSLLDRVARGAPDTGDAVVRETLRLQPPAFALLRRLAAPRDVAGHRGGARAPLLRRDPPPPSPAG